MSLSTDLRGIDDRYFALHVPPAMTFASLLAVADLAATMPPSMSETCRGRLALL